MTHAHGAYLGGIRTLADLRARCKVDECTGCWHLRTARGQAMPRGMRHYIHVYGRGSMSALRIAYELGHGGGPVPLDRVVYRACYSYDCIAPGHIRRGTRKMLNAQAKALDKQVSARKTAANIREGLRRSVIGPELREWIMESAQSGVEIGSILGVSQSHVNTLRAKMRRALAEVPR